jgi:hypothetical protein
VAKQHHRMLGFKSENGGRSRAKAGVMRRLSMVALRSTVRHVLRGLAVVNSFPPAHPTFSFFLLFVVFIFDHSLLTPAVRLVGGHQPFSS